MERATFLWKVVGCPCEALKRVNAALPALGQRAKALGAANPSVWQAEKLVFGYFEAENIATVRVIGAAVREAREALGDAVEVISSPGNMRRMYTALGTPKTDKSCLGHRVFMTRLKPGMAEEYRSRHAAIETDDAPAGPVNNFTIWNGGDYICGYAELDEGYALDKSAEGMEPNRAWETSMLEVMDWLTDDVDSLFGFHHDPVRCLYNGNL